jgi:hypothetical protein
MPIILPILLIVIMIFVLAFRQNAGMWTNLIMLGNVVVAALVATNYFEPLAGLLSGYVSFLMPYADVLSLWVIFALTLMLLKAITDVVSRTRVRFPMPLEILGSLFAIFATGWVFVCLATFSIHLSSLSRVTFGGGFKPETGSFFGFAPDRLWMGFVQRESQGTLAGSSTFDEKGDMLVRYAARREQFDRPAK